MNKDLKIQQLEEEIERMRFVIDQVPNFLFWKDVNSIFLGCNKAFAKTAGLERSVDIVGKSDFELPWSPEDSENYRADDRAVMKAAKPKLNIEEAQTVKGRKITLLTSKVPLMDDGEVKGIIGIYSDITELKEAQEALEAQKIAAEVASTVKSNFLATMSHELRTPLNGILGTLEIMKRRYLESEMTAFIGDIEGAASSLLNLVNDILDISCLEQGRLVIKRSVFELREVVDRAISDGLHVIGQKEIELKLFSTLRSTDQFYGDAFRIKQVLVNLISNAIKFTDSGSVSVYVDLKKEDGIASLDFSVVDTGIGISSQMCDQIFERFIQIDAKYDRRYQGVGLGLAICKELVGAMGGIIGVESLLGRGSTFYFSVPIDICQQHVEKPLAFTKEQMAKISGSLLIVEDNPLNSRVLSLMLEDFSIDFKLAESGQEALDLLKNNTFNLIFLDISLPDMDGFLITERIRAQKTKLELPIIAVTAHAYESDKIACLESGMNDVLVKPINMHELTKKLMQWLPLPQA